MATRMLRISDAVSLALHTMAILVGTPDRLITTHEIAEILGASENHLAKVRQLLARAGLVQAIRGPSGGFRLAKAPEGILLMDIYEAIEGPFRPCDCLLGRPVSDGVNCVLGGLTESVNRQVREYLSGTTLAQLAHSDEQSTRPGLPCRT